MKYVLLLRGINVGGKNKVSMSELKEQLISIGFENVSSYINSGNLFFSSLENHEICSSKIRDLLDTNYDFSIPFSLITKEEYLEEKEGLPDWWKEDLARKDVLFFSYNFDKSNIFDFIDNATFHNEVVYVGRHAVFWGKYDESEYLKTTYHKKINKARFL